MYLACLSGPAKAPLPSPNPLAEWPIQRRIVMSDDVLRFHHGSVGTRMTIDNQYRIEAKATSSTACAVDAILSFHSSDHDTSNAAGPQVTRQIGAMPLA